MERLKSRLNLEVGQQVQARIVSGRLELERFPMIVEELNPDSVRLAEVAVPTISYILPRKRIEERRRVGLFEITEFKE